MHMHIANGVGYMAIHIELERLLAQQIAKQHNLTVHIYCITCNTSEYLEIDIRHWFTFSTPLCKKCKQKMLVTTHEVEVKTMAVSKAGTSAKQPAENNQPIPVKQEAKQPAENNQPIPVKPNLPYTNSITINGRLYANAEKVELNGYACIKFDVAHWQPKNRPTQAYHVLVFEESLFDYAGSLKKGIQVMVSGRLTTDMYNNKPQLSILANMISTNILEVTVVEQLVQ